MPFLQAGHCHKPSPLSCAGDRPTADSKHSAQQQQASMGLAGFNTNLTDQLAFYGAYHHNKWNQLIHLIFVPAIMWSAFVWAAYTGSLVPWDCSAHLHFLPHWLSR